MCGRVILLLGLLALAGCGEGNPAFTSKAGTGPYDLSDKFLDAQGNPLPGWWYMRDPAGGSGGGSM